MHSGIQIDGTAEVSVRIVEDPKVIGGETYYDVVFMQDDTMSHRVQMNYSTLLNLVTAITS